MCAAALGGPGLSARFDYHAVVHTLRSFPTLLLAEALLATGLSYGALVGRDVLAMRYLHEPVPRSTLWLGAFIGSALGNAVGSEY